MLYWDLQNLESRLWVPNHLGNWLKSHEIKKNSVVTGIEQTTWGLSDQRRSRSANQAPRFSSKLMESKAILRYNIMTTWTYGTT